MNKLSKHWLVMIYMCGLSAAAIGVSANCLGVFYVPVSNALGVMRGTLTFAITIASIITAVINLFILKLLNNKNFKKYMLLGIIMASGATALMSMVTSIWHFYLLNVFRGIGLALFGAVIYTTIINNWFNKKHGLATSIVMGFTGIAGAIGTPIFNSIITNNGWRFGFVVMGIVLLVITLPAAIFPYSFDPAYDNLLPYGNEKRNVIKYGDSSFNYHSLTYVCILLFGLLMSLFTGISQHLAGYAETINLGSGVGSFMISLCMIGNVSGKLIVGTLSDIIGWFKSILVMMVIVVVAAIILLVSNNALMCYAGSLLLGANYAVAAVGLVLITKNVFGSENYHMAYPLISFCSSISSAFANSMIGYVYDFTGSYRLVFVIVLIISVIGFGLLFIANKSYAHGA